jgi:hypothetical protein
LLVSSFLFVLNILSQEVSSLRTEGRFSMNIAYLDVVSAEALILEGFKLMLLCSGRLTFELGAMMGTNSLLLLHSMLPSSGP